MDLNELNESNIGLRIKSQFKFNVAKHLKIVRCCSSLVRSVSFLVFAENDLKNKNFLQCGSNLYYSAFHLSFSLLMLEDSTLKMSDYLVGSNITSDIKQKRIFDIAHKDLPNRLAKIEGNKDFKNNLVNTLQKLIEMRELYAYGPFMQLIDDEDISEKNIGFLYRFVLSREHFDVHKKPHVKVNEPIFTEMYKTCEIEKENISKLVDSFFEIFVDRSKHFGNNQSSMLMYVLPALIPNMLSPLSNKSILNDVESKMNPLAALLGKDPEIKYKRGKKKFFKSAQKIVKKGELLSSVRLGFYMKHTVNSGRF